MCGLGIRRAGYGKVSGDIRNSRGACHGVHDALVSVGSRAVGCDVRVRRTPPCAYAPIVTDPARTSRTACDPAVPHAYGSVPRLIQPGPHREMRSTFQGPGSRQPRGGVPGGVCQWTQIPSGRWQGLSCAACAWIPDHRPGRGAQGCGWGGRGGEGGGGQGPGAGGPNFKALCFKLCRI